VPTNKEGWLKTLRYPAARGGIVTTVTILVLAIAPAIASAASSAPSHTSAGQRATATTTYGCTGYKYAGNVTNNAANEGVYGDIRAEGETYGGTSSSHMAAWLGSNTPEDDSQSPIDDEDWLQGGYLIGSADGVTVTSQVMYSEATGPGYGGILDLYPQYGLGNQFFESSITSTTSGSYGLYYMFDNTTLIGDSYLINPTDTYQEALIESYGASIIAACPSISDGLFGTTGSNDSYNSGTEIFIIRHGYEPDLWQSEISTSEVANSPYVSHYWVDWSAYQAYGS
jgi:hypothetical protein